MASAWREAGLGRIHPPLRGGGHQHRDPGRSGAQSRDLRQAGSGYRLRRFREDGLKERAGVFPRLRGKCQAKPDEGGVSRECDALRNTPRFAALSTSPVHGGGHDQSCSSSPASGGGGLKGRRGCVQRAQRPPIWAPAFAGGR